MGNVVIKIEEIAKSFEVGSLGASTFKQDLLAWVDGLTNKKNPRTKKDLFGHFGSIRLRLFLKALGLVIPTAFS